MKKISTLVIALLFGTLLFAQSQYEISRDQNGSKVLKGIITRKDLATDTAFSWFADNQKGYTPNATALELLKKNAKDLQFIVFSGTWCGDSKTIVPKFYALADAAGLTDDHITLIGTDRSKKSLGHITEAMNIVSVPTIVVMKDGKELGRVVEYGKYGLFDMELADIFKAVGGKQ